MPTKPCYCINPRCTQPDHPSNNNSNTHYCLSCGSSLLLNGKYRVSRILSNNSGFGVVFEVFEGFTAKILKVLQERWNNQPKAIELFKREYEVLFVLTAQKITGIPQADAYFTYQTQKSLNLYCLVMEKVEGLDLEQWINNHGKLNQKQGIKWLREITLILDKIHNQSWFHRDIKPPNIMIRNSGELALIDFGTAREETQTYYQKLQGQHITGIESPGYTPEEQKNGQAVLQSDFFALGRTFVHLLTGKHPLQMYDGYNNVLNWRRETENINYFLLDFIDELMAASASNRPANTGVILQRLNEIEKELNKTIISPLPPPPRDNSSKRLTITLLLLLGIGYGITKLNWNNQTSQNSPVPATSPPSLTPILTPTPIQSPVALTPRPVPVSIPTKTDSSSRLPIPPTILTKPDSPKIITPSTTNITQKRSPKESILSYYEAINNGEYPIAWEKLPIALQNDKKIHPNGYSSFVNWYAQIKPIKVTTINLIQQEEKNSIVYIKYQYILNKQKIKENLRYSLVWDDQRQDWKFDKIGKL